MSRLVATYCEKHHVDAESFKSLTTSATLPSIATDVALKFMQLEASVSGTESDEMTNLKTRCLRCIEESREPIDDEVFDEMMEFLSPTPATLSAINLCRHFKRKSDEMAKEI